MAQRFGSHKAAGEADGRSLLSALTARRLAPWGSGRESRPLGADAGNLRLNNFAPPSRPLREAPCVHSHLVLARTIAGRRFKVARGPADRLGQDLSDRRGGLCRRDRKSGPAHGRQERPPGRTGPHFTHCQTRPEIALIYFQYAIFDLREVTACLARKVKTSPLQKPARLFCRQHVFAKRMTHK